MWCVCPDSLGLDDTTRDDTDFPETNSLSLRYERISLILTSVSFRVKRWNTGRRAMGASNLFFCETLTASPHLEISPRDVSELPTCRLEGPGDVVLGALLVLMLMVNFRLEEVEWWVGLVVGGGLLVSMFVFVGAGWLAGSIVG